MRCIAKVDFIGMDTGRRGNRPGPRRTADAMNHAAARIPKVVTETLLLDHGDTETSPSPAPSIKSASDIADAAKAPAMTAAQETEDTEHPFPASGPRDVYVASDIQILRLPIAMTKGRAQ
jgi:hypothetical protein